MHRRDAAGTLARDSQRPQFFLGEIMRSCRLVACLSGGLLLASLIACSPPAPGVVPAASAHPDLSGVWMAFAAVNPDGGPAPKYSADGTAALAAFAAQFKEIPETGAYCVPGGMPGVMLTTVSYPIEIVQTASRLVMLAELEMQVRRVFLDGREHPTDYLPTGVGHSIGRWDGDKLVIDTSLLEEWQLKPWPRSEQAHVVERLYLTKRSAVSAQANAFVASVEKPINDDVLVVEMTLTDPAYYDGPQKRIAYYQRMADTATLEYACAAELWLKELEKNRVSR
jgi:hypothetical protein